MVPIVSECHHALWIPFVPVPVALKEGKINDGKSIPWPSFSPFPPAFHPITSVCG